MLPNHFLIRRDVDAINLVLRDIAVQSLNLRAKVVQDAA